MILLVLQSFLIKLLAGISVMLCLMPHKNVASAFFRIQMFVLLALGCLAAVLATPRLPWLAGGVMATLAFFGSALWLLERRQAGMTLLAAIALISTGSLVWLAASHPQPWLWAASFLASAGTLGGTMTGMLLGHRYLTAPGMPLLPLQRLNLYLAVAVALRLLLSAAPFVWGLLPGSTDMVSLSLRWLAGIVGPGVATLLIWRILRYRNTQAATGVLFAAVIFAFIGELTAELLSQSLPFPI